MRDDPVRPSTFGRVPRTSVRSRLPEGKSRRHRARELGETLTGSCSALGERPGTAGTHRRDLAHRLPSGVRVLAGPGARENRRGKARRHRVALAAAGAAAAGRWRWGLEWRVTGSAQARHRPRHVVPGTGKRANPRRRHAGQSKSEADKQVEAATRARAEAVHEAETAPWSGTSLQETIAAGDPEKRRDAGHDRAV